MSEMFTLGTERIASKYSRQDSRIIIKVVHFLNLHNLTVLPVE